MPKIITLTRPNGLKFEVMVDEIAKIKFTYWRSAPTFVHLHRDEKNDIAYDYGFPVLETKTQIETLIEEAKKEEEKCSFGERAVYHYIIAEKNKLIEDLMQQLSEQSKPKTTNLTREEMLKAIDEGKDVVPQTLIEISPNWKLIVHNAENNYFLNKDTRWDIVE